MHGPNAPTRPAHETSIWNPLLIAVAALATCWGLMFFGPITFGIVPIVIGTCWGLFAERRRSVALLVFVLNPVALSFLQGVHAYMAGRPAHRGAGLPSIESFNPDAESRCFYSGGGCCLSGDEWVTITTHNIGLDFMCSVFGPPSSAYSGPYPSKEEAVMRLTDAKGVLTTDLLADSVPTHEGVHQLEEAIGETIVRQLGFLVGSGDEKLPEELNVHVSAALFQGRCLVIQIQQQFTNLDYIMLADAVNGKPFAYYDMSAIGHSRFPPVEYDDPKYLHALKRASYAGALERLLATGAPVDTQSPTGRTPLMTAVLAQQVDAVTVLLKHGANPEMQDNNGESATDMAERRGDLTIIDLLNKHAQ